MRVLVKNRKASHDYEILDTFVAGIALLGPETKSILQGNCSIGEGYVSVRGGSAFLSQVHIDRYKMSDGFSDTDERRERRLLLTKTEIKKISKQVSEKGLTVIPLKVIYSDSKKIKVEIAVCRGKKTYDKRHDLKKKQQEMDIRRAAK